MAIAVRCLSARYYDGFHIKPHQHVSGQLIYAAAGLMRVRAGNTLWLIPPARAVWAPPGARHEIHALGDFSMRTIYFRPDLVSDLPGECCAVEVAPLLRELVLELVELCPIDGVDAAGMRMAQVAIDCLVKARTLPLNLPLPRDPRAVRLAERLRNEPGSHADLGQLAREAGASARTMQRLFLAETRMSFAQWRQRLRLLHGATQIAMGKTITEAGLEAGYSGTSAFIAAFRKQFGVTPSRLG